MNRLGTLPERPVVPHPPSLVNLSTMRPVMKAIRIHTPGGREAMRLEDVPVPRPGAGQALVRLEAAGVNFIDVYRRSGQYKLPLPFTLGSEGGGVVEALGPDAPPDAGVRVGDRVAYEGTLGAYADYAVVPVDRLVVLPEGVSTRQGAALMLQGMTAHYLATSTYALKSGDTCLVHAAAGGVGLLLCQIASRMRGARVIGTVSTEEKAALARAAGASDVILYTRQNFVDEVKRLTGGAGVQVVYDSVGRTTFDKSMDCLTRRGLLVLFGQSSGAVAPFDPQLLNQKGSLYLTRPTLAHYTVTPAALRERAGEVMGWVARGELSLRINAELPLAEAAEAHRRLESRETTGKLLLIP
jgi:NADPH:quinone reductase